MKAKKTVAKPIRNPKKTRAKLLQTGKDLFAANGYHGVAVDDIVTKAACNKRMLYHYFGSKDGLYEAVLKEVLGQFKSMPLRPAKAAEAPLETLHALIHDCFSFLHKNADFTRLLIWENLDQGKCLERYPELLTESPLLERIEALIEKTHGTTANRSNADDCQQLFITMLIFCSAPFMSGQTLKYALGLDLAQPLEVKRYLKFIEGVISQLYLSHNHNSGEREPGTGYPLAESKDAIMDEPENFWELG
jgi:AcrR family transcriptional regulator